MAVERARLFSEKVAAGGRTYFFDVKQTKSGGHYLVISESRPKDGSFEHQRLTIFSDSVAAFGAALQKAAGFIQGKAS